MNMESGVPLLLSDRGCPFAHRVLALLERLGVPFERREVAVGDEPEGLHHYTSSGQVPLLVDGELVLTESRVMLEYLSERFVFEDAYPGELEARTRHRHAMAVADGYLVPRLGNPALGVDSARLSDVLGIVELATGTTPPIPCLLAMHLAPIWIAFSQWHPRGVITAAIQARPSLSSWLEAATELDCIRTVAVDAKTLAEDVRRARAAGLLPEAS